MACQYQSRAYWPPSPLLPYLFLPFLVLSSPPFCTRGQQGLEKRGYYLSVVHPTSRTPMFLFHSSGVAHFPAAITGREIKTGPSWGIASPSLDSCEHVNGHAGGTWSLSASPKWLMEEIGKLTGYTWWSVCWLTDLYENVLKYVKYSEYKYILYHTSPVDSGPVWMLCLVHTLRLVQEAGLSSTDHVTMEDSGARCHIT